MSRKCRPQPPRHQRTINLITNNGHSFLSQLITDTPFNFTTFWPTKPFTSSARSITCNDLHRIDNVYSGHSLLFFSSFSLPLPQVSPLFPPPPQSGKSPAPLSRPLHLLRPPLPSLLLFRSFLLSTSPFSPFRSHPSVVDPHSASFPAHTAFWRTSPPPFHFDSTDPLSLNR